MEPAEALVVRSGIAMARCCVTSAWRAVKLKAHTRWYSSNGASAALERDDVAFAVMSLRQFGHFYANLDPLQRAKGHVRTEALEYCPGDDRVRPPVGLLPSSANRSDVADIVQAYTGTLALDASAVCCREAEEWLYSCMERRLKSRSTNWPASARRALLVDLHKAEALEHSLSRHFKRSKRFGIEGSEALMPGLFHLFRRASALGATSVDLGMAHRGRLNVLINVLGKPYAELCAEMEGKQSKVHVGDVKYHLPASSVVTFARESGDSTSKHLAIRLAPNPSHLEHVTPLVLGSCRARQQNDARSGETISAASRQRHWAVIVHGDAAFAGQGIAVKSAQLSLLDGYSVGGAIHVVVDNQIGFTATPERLYSSTHCASAFAAAARCPVLFANGDDPEAVIDGFRIAATFRAKFERDAVVVLRCYRRLGHNENDDPSMTQPVLYRERIANHPTLPNLYGAKLVQEGLVDADAIANERVMIDESLDRSRLEQSAFEIDDRRWFIERGWQVRALASSLREGHTRSDGQPHVPEPTGLPLSTLRWLRARLADCVTSDTGEFEAHPDVRAIYHDAFGGNGQDERVDWATSEALAFGTLLLHRSAGPIKQERRDLAAVRLNTCPDGDLDRDPLLGLNYGAYRVRLSGQDSGRGTFGQRHSVVRDLRSTTGRCLTPLNEIAAGQQERFEVVDSPLSEASVLGFEYGYSIVGSNSHSTEQEYEKSLVIWEAQFGDFVNVAQALVDTYVMSAEEKWGLSSNLVLLLPHGFDGMGPDHSSGRIERFLQMINDDPDSLPGANARDRHLIERSFAALDVHGTGMLDPEQLAQMLSEFLKPSENNGGSARETKSPQQASARAVLRRLRSNLESQRATNGEVTPLDNLLGSKGGITLNQWRRMMVQYLRLHNEKEINVHVCIPTTPANYFHLLRRQMNRTFDKPLVIFSPKYLLHHRLARSDLTDFIVGTHFNRVIDDGKLEADNTRHLSSHPRTRESFNLPSEQIRRVVLCSGQIYYALNKARRHKYDFQCFYFHFCEHHVSESMQTCSIRSCGVD